MFFLTSSFPLLGDHSVAFRQNIHLNSDRAPPVYHQNQIPLQSETLTTADSFLPITNSEGIPYLPSVQQSLLWFAPLQDPRYSRRPAGHTSARNSTLLLLLHSDANC